MFRVMLGATGFLCTKCGKILSISQCMSTVALLTGKYFLLPLGQDLVKEVTALLGDLVSYDVPVL